MYNGFIRTDWAQVKEWRDGESPEYLSPNIKSISEIWVEEILVKKKGNQV